MSHRLTQAEIDNEARLEIEATVFASSKSDKLFVKNELEAIADLYKNKPAKPIAPVPDRPCSRKSKIFLRLVKKIQPKKLSFKDIRDCRVCHGPIHMTKNGHNRQLYCDSCKSRHSNRKMIKDAWRRYEIWKMN